MSPASAVTRSRCTTRDRARSSIESAVGDAGVAPLAVELSFPEGMAVDGHRLLVVETGIGQVTAIDLATGNTSPVIVGLNYSDRIPEGFFPFGLMSGVAVGERSIYVVDDGVNQVYEFRRHP